jgi:predicted DNA-binding transcriptional regulator AlpA
MSSERPAAPKVQPRIIRFRDAPLYLGMDRNRFNLEVRPYVTEVPIGKQGVGFDRLELDAWLDDYIARQADPREANLPKHWIS